MNRSDKALKLYSQGLNCAQSVIASFADILELDEDKAIRIASGFGGGMGGMQGTCGAATGAYMVIGYLRGRVINGTEVSNDETNALVQEFSKRFAQKHQSTNCKALISFDLNTEKGKKEAEKADVFNTKCTLFVTTAVEILDEILN
ncbi:MAG: C_GCAxxG_C_C family protein [Bacteroidales bacterium]|nr:C_GCAxxG_C_C family protein [Bacteroidales bacterium]